jgi:glutamyl-tRNA reductase
MSILLVGVNHRSGPLSVLEQVTLAPDAVPEAVATLARSDNIREVAVLSTCNRTEIYAVTERFHGAYDDITGFLSALSGLESADLAAFIFARHDDAAVEHLFEVTAGLDSVVLGESQILGQVKTAWEVAQGEGGTRNTLNLLFRHAITVGKRVRTETSIGRGTASIGHAAVEMVVEHLGPLQSIQVLVVGAGEMGEGIAIALHRAGAREIVVANRTVQRGDALAYRVEGRSIGFEQLPAALDTADLVLTCTGSEEPVITAPLLSSARQPLRPMLLVDVALPRDVESAVRDLTDVTVWDLDDLRTWAERGRSLRLSEVDTVRSILREQIDQFGAESTALQATPLVIELREHAEQLRLQELERLRGKLTTLTPEQRDAVDAVTRSILAKLLHTPSVRLKDQAGTPRGERNAAAVVDLFDLG